MIGKTTSWGWVLGIVMSGAFISSTNSALAQITPDSTLPNNSRVTTSGNTSLIEGGTQAGGNLFHSFQQFSVSPGSTAYFNNQLDIQNIISRVTGGSISNINGLIRANGTANLFFLNPNGIVFGSRASLNIGGSFVATTANAIGFSNQGFFNASNPNNPALLTVNPSALLFNQIAATALIQNNSQARVGGNVVGLQVPDGKSLLLVGGNVNSDGGGLTASGGRVELAGLAAPGTVGLNVAGNTLSLSVPSDVQLGDVSLSNQAFVDVSGAGGGDIAINARNLKMSNSSLFAGIGIGLGNGSTKAGNINITADAISLTDGAQIDSFTGGKGDAGDILITARNTISLDNQSHLGSLTFDGSEGNAGNINITTGSLSATNGGGLGSTIAGKGNAGNVTIIARDAVTFDGVSNELPSNLLSNVQAGAVGNGGNVNITAGSLSLTNGAELSTGVQGVSGNLTGGKGQGGTVNLNLRDALTISGANSGIFANLDAGSVGRGGDINIQAGNVFIRNGGQITSFTSGTGNAGNVTINARDVVSFDGIDSNGNPSSSSSEVEAGAVGDGGNINITAGTLSLTNSGYLSTGVREAFNSLAGGQGQGGTVNLNLRDALTISGANSGISTSLEAGAIGRGGDINIQAGNVFVRDGGQINSFTSGKGNAGNVTIIARNAVNFDGVDSNGIYSSLSSDVAPGGVGSGGKIDITAGSLSLTNGAELSTDVYGAFNTLLGGQGQGGTINLNLRDALTISGSNSGIFANLDAGAVGRGGDINIQAGNVVVRDGNQINSFTSGKGSAGNITIIARDAVTFDGVDSNRNYSGLSSDVEPGGVGNGGKINITAGSLSLTNGAELNSSINGTSGNLTDGKGIGGIINLNLRDALTISGTNSGVFADLSAGAVGSGGNINIQAGNVFVINSGQIRSSTFGQGDAGNISITARDKISLDAAGSYIISNVQSNDAKGHAGNIDITTGSLSATRGAEINSFTRGTGNAGNMTITARDAVTFDGVDSNGNHSGLSSGVLAGGVGNGGKINITAGLLSLTNGAELNSSINETSGNLTGGQGIGGTINLNLRDALTISGTNSGVFANLNAGAVGRAGDINIQAGNVFVKNGSQINSFTRGTGNAGNVTIIARDAVTFDGVDSNGNSSGSLSDVEPGGVGNGGSITIKTKTLTTRNSNISTTTRGKGDAGNLTIIASDSVDLSGDSYNPLTPASGSPGGLLAQVDGLGQGKGGNLYIETGRLSISDGSKVQVATLGDGDAGNLFIHADEIDVFNTGKPYFFPTSIAGGVLIDKRVQEGIGPDPRNGKPPTGNGGRLTIETRLLNVSNGGQITSSSVAQGKAGDINIIADIARLNNGQIIGQTAFSDGGNINFNLSQYLLLRNGSQISATAGTAQKGGDGGNITINSKFIIAVPEENSDITANAYTGKGGSVQINTQGIFGTQFRSQLTPESDITASSTFGVSGIVNINAPDTSFLQNSFTQLPQNLIDTNVLIANSCIVRSSKLAGTFIITGSGGLPNRPGDASISSYPTGTVQNIPGDRTTLHPWKKGDPIVEPQGVYQLPNGHLVLSRECP